MRSECAAVSSARFDTLSHAVEKQSAPPPKLEPDQVIGERFRLRRCVGEGGMGWVWEATTLDEEQSRVVALKFLKGGKEEDRRRFLREARAAAAIEHPNVIAMKEVVELPEQGLLLTVMDFLDGESLGAILKREKKIALDGICAVAIKVTHALEAAHAAGVVHRDLKPDNIFLSATSGVKVLDFGVAKLTATEGLAARTQALTGTGAMVGTPYYMSPEQVVSEDDLDGRADIWSLGVVLYEAIAGVRPTEAENVGRVLKRILVADFTSLRERAPELPEDVLALVDRMLVIDRKERPSLSDVRKVLEAHASKTIPTFAKPTTATIGGKNDDALADTVLAARTTRGDTHAAVSVVAPEPKPRRRVGTWIIGFAAAAASAFALWRFSPSPTPGSAPQTPTATTTTTIVTTTASATIAPAPTPTPAIEVPPPSATATAAKTKPAAAAPRVVPSLAVSAEPPIPSATPSAAPASSSRLPPNLARSPKD